jgi:hypothetical protein
MFNINELTEIYHIFSNRDEVFRFIIDCDLNVTQVLEWIEHIASDDHLWLVKKDFFEFQMNKASKRKKIPTILPPPPFVTIRHAIINSQEKV